MFRRKSDRVTTEILSIQQQLENSQHEIRRASQKIEAILADPNGFTRKKITEEILNRVRHLAEENAALKRRESSRYHTPITTEECPDWSIIKNLLEELEKFNSESQS